MHPPREASRPATEQSPPVAGQRDPDEPPVRVLVVDDHPAFRVASAAVVRRTPGFLVAGAAATGEEALAMLAAVRPDLVLLDVRLPGIDGVETAARIAREAPGTVVFLCSSYGRDDLPDAVRGAQAAAYLHKEDLSADALSRLWRTSRRPG